MSPPKPSLPPVHRLLHVNTPAPLLRLVERFCQTKNFSVESFESGTVAFHHALLKPYRLILVGAPLAGMDIPRLLNGLNRAKITAPVLIMTETRWLGKTDYSQFPNCIGEIAKPLDLTEFAKYLENAAKPIEITPQEMEQLLAVLRKWEKRMSDAV